MSYHYSGNIPRRLCSLEKRKLVYWGYKGKIGTQSNRCIEKQVDRLKNNHIHNIDNDSAVKIEIIRG